MVFKNNIPTAGDFLSVSQGDLKDNNAQLDASFLVDHYTFSDLTANNGKHNQMTTPLIIGGVHPTTAASEPKIYAMQDTANVGVINYSRGPSNAVPTPITHLHSTAAAIIVLAGNTTNVLDFTGLTRAFCMLYSMDTATISTNKGLFTIYWTGAVFNINQISTGAPALVAQTTGNILQLKNTSGGNLNTVFWTLDMQRLS